MNTITPINFKANYQSIKKVANVAKQELPEASKEVVKKSPELKSLFKKLFVVTGLSALFVKNNINKPENKVEEIKEHEEVNSTEYITEENLVSEEQDSKINAPYWKNKYYPVSRYVYGRPNINTYDYIGKNGKSLLHIKVVDNFGVKGGKAISCVRDLSIDTIDIFEEFAKDYYLEDDVRKEYEAIKASQKSVEG